MASRASIVAFVVDQLGEAVAAKPMFGEYGVYRAGTLIGLICDGRLFLKPTTTARSLLVDAEEAPPYPGAKPALVVHEEHWDDAELMRELARVTADELATAPKRPRRRSK